MSTVSNRGNYNTYTTQTKLELIRSGNSNYFINEGVPRTTAIHWLKNSHKLEHIESQPNQYYEMKIKLLEKKLLTEATLKNLLLSARKLHPYSFNKKKVRKKLTKQKILNEIHSAQKIVSLNTCLSTIGLSPTTYYRWISIFHSCQLKDKKCSKRRPHQLTENEVNIMKFYVTNQKYSHISVSSLHLLAQRENKLFCSLDTWYKYINLFEWLRPKPQKQKKKYPIGLRASKPNEAWHVDVSELIFFGRKYYFQAVIDNFSRFIIVWTLTDNKQAQNTVNLLQLAKNRLPLHQKATETKLIMDAGSENTADKVTKFISTKNITRLIAQQDIKSSNSMIESFFRSLKNNYFNHQKIRSLEDIRRKIKFYVTQHNEAIPKLCLKGATPKEAFSTAWTVKHIESLKEQRKVAVKNRKIFSKRPTCELCS